MPNKDFKDRLGKIDESKISNLSSICNYIPFKGWSINAVIIHSPQFIRWMITRDMIELDNEAYNEYIYQLESQSDAQSNED